MTHFYCFWEVADDNIVGKYSVRRGEKKVVAEIEDIFGAMKKLEQANDLQMIIANSEMVA